MDPKGINISRRRWITLALSIFAITGVAIAIISVMRRTSGMEVHIVNPLAIIPFLFFTALFILMKVYGWRYAVSVFTPVRISMRESYFHLGILAVAKYVPGKIWGQASRILMVVNKGAANKDVILAAAVEQVSIFLGLLYLSSFGLIHYLGMDHYFYAIAFIAGLLVVLAIGRNIKPISEALGRSRIGFVRNLAVLRDVDARKFYTFFGIGLGQWIFNCAAHAIFALIFFDHFTTMDLVLIYFAVPAAVVAGMLAVFAPGGIGVREVVLVAILAGSLGQEEVIYYALLMRIWETLRDVLLFGSALVLKRIKGLGPADSA